MVQKADMNDKYDAIVDICNTFESENAAFYRTGTMRASPSPSTSYAHCDSQSGCCILLRGALLGIV